MVARRIHFSGDDSSPPAKKPDGYRARLLRWLWKPSRQGYTVFFGIVLALLAILGVSDVIGRQLPERQVEVLVVDWILKCQVTHRGEAKADEVFEGARLEKLVKDGIFVHRMYPDTRVSCRVKVKNSQRGGPVQPGSYTLYGTVTSVDVCDKRLELTDCVFVPEN
jgi:hypothetical protein